MYKYTEDLTWKSIDPPMLKPNHEDFSSEDSPAFKSIRLGSVISQLIS